MPPLDGTTIGGILAGLVALVTAFGTVQTRRDGARRRELLEIRVELARQRKTNIAAVRYIYQCQLLLAARGVAESALPALPAELEELFRGDEAGSGESGDSAPSAHSDAGSGGHRRRHREDDHGAR